MGIEYHLQICLLKTFEWKLIQQYFIDKDGFVRLNIVLFQFCITIFKYINTFNSF